MLRERRRTPRHPLGRVAAIMFGQGQEHPCLVKDYSDGGVRLQPNGFEVPDDFALLFAPNDEAVVIRWFGDWEGTWVLNLLAPRPPTTDAIPRHDSAESASAF